MTKRFGQLCANRDVSLDLHGGQIHALLGENGAGKTTLMNTLFGLVPPDSGEIAVRGTPTVIHTPHEALALGIGMVHQHFMLIPKFTVLENIVMGASEKRTGIYGRSKLETEVQSLIDEYSFDLDPMAPIETLPVEMRQRVEILKLLYRHVDVLILDEPTSLLGPAQVEALCRILEDLRSNGKAIVIVTHKLREVMRLADQVTVLRGGVRVLSSQRGSYDERALATAMTGTEIPDLPTRLHVASSTRREPLEVEELVVTGDAGNRAVDGISFVANGGEILGVAGVAGNGQQELVHTIAGVRKAQSGKVTLDGLDITHLSPRDRRAGGLGVIMDNRAEWGLILKMTIAENLALGRIATDEPAWKGILDRDFVRRHAVEILDKYGIQPADPDRMAGALSGGNQQKVVLARELENEPKILIATTPTQGLDVGATDAIRRRLIEVRNAGRAVMLVSNDLDELLSVADRMVVLFKGRIVYERTTAEATREEIAMAMAGSAPLETVTG